MEPYKTFKSYYPDGNIPSMWLLAYMNDCMFNKREIKTLEKTGSNPELLKELKEDYKSKKALIKEEMELRRRSLEVE